MQDEVISLNHCNDNCVANILGCMRCNMPNFIPTDYKEEHDGIEGISANDAIQPNANWIVNLKEKHGGAC